MKNCKLLVLFLFTLSIIACSPEEDEEMNSASISNQPLSGTLFSSDFTAISGRADASEVFGIESLVVLVSGDNLGCETGQFSGAFPIQITFPRVIGFHDNDVYVSFNDPNSSNFVSVSSGITVQVESLQTDSVIFKIKASSLGTDNSIEGRHQVSICL